MVGHCKARLFAHGLDLGDEFALDALFDECGGEAGVERHGDALVGSGHIPFGAFGGDEKVCLRQLDLRAADLGGECAAVLDGGDQRRAVARFQIGADGVQEFAVFGAERLHLRLDAVGDESGSVLRKAHLFDVQLVEDDALQLLVQVELAARRHHHFGQRLAVFEGAGVARGAAEHDDVEHGIHARFQVFIDGGLVAGGKGAHVHGFGRFRIKGGDEVLIDLFGKEGSEGRGQLGEGDEHGVQRGVCRRLVFRHALAPIALAAAAHIPVGEHVGKFLQGAGGVGDVIGGEAFVYRPDEGIQLGQDPLVHQRQFAAFQIVFGRIVAVDIGVEGEEGVAVPQRAHVAALRFGHRLGIEAGRDPRGAGSVEVPADGVCPLLVEDGPGIDDVALVFGHFDAVFVVDVPQNDAVFERRPAEEDGGDDQQRIEPAARLIHRLGDEVGGEGLVEEVFVFKRVMVLRKGHGAGIEPAVDDLGRALHGAAAFALEGAVVDIRAVQLDVALDAAELFELLLAADDVHFAAVGADPHGQRRAPVAVARQAPVDDVFQKVAHAPGADGIRHPVHGVVGLDELVFDGGHLDEPALAGVVQEGRIAPPAVRVAVLVGHLFEQQALFLEHGDDALVRLFDELPGKVGDGGLEAAALVHQIDHGQAVLLPHAVVVFAEGGGDVDDARAVGEGDVAVADDVVRLFAVAALGIGEEGLVLGVFVFLALFDGEEGVAPFFKQRRKQRLRQYIALPCPFDLGVVFFRVHAQGDVGRQRPGRGRPGEEPGMVLPLAAEADEHGGLFDVFIPLRHLVRGERRAAARAVRDDLVPLVQESLFPDLFQRPPDRFDIVVVIGDVRVLHIRPVADPFGHLFPLALVLPHALLALLDEGLDAVLFDILLAVHAQRLFHFQLDGQAVRIPARLAQDVAALHGLVAGDDVLHDAGEDMPDVRLAVGRRGAVVKGKFLSALALFDALFKDALLFPELDDFFLSADEIHRRVYFFIHRIAPAVRFKKTGPSFPDKNRETTKTYRHTPLLITRRKYRARGYLACVRRAGCRVIPPRPCLPPFTCRGSLKRFGVRGACPRSKRPYPY